MQPIVSLKKTFANRTAVQSAIVMMLLGCASAYAQTQAPIVIRAKGTLAGNVGPIMEVRANGRILGQVEVRSSNFTNYPFALPAGVTFTSSVDVIFKNDAVINGQDRNLIVESVSANGKSQLPTASGVTYDRGDNAAALDGKDVIPGQQGMWWSGALRFKWNSDPVNNGDLLSQVHTKGKIPNLTPSGPITITGSAVIENRKISNPNGPCIDIKAGSSNVIIRNNEIGPCGKGGIEIDSADGVQVIHNYIHDTTTVTRMKDSWLENRKREELSQGITEHANYDTSYPGTEIDGNAIQAGNTKNLTVRFNYIQNVTSGLHLYGEESRNLVFDKNYVVDVHSDRSRSKILRMGGQMVQVNGMTNGAGTRVTCNVSDQRSANADSEDHVNFYKSQGTAATPILIAYNRLLGSHTSPSSAGTQTGDDYGRYIRTYKNNYFNSGTVGASISGGTNMSIEANKIFHSADYRAKHPYWWPAAIKVFQGEEASVMKCENHMVINNKIDTVKPGWGGENIVVDGSCSGVRVSGNVQGPSPELNEQALANERFPECQ